MTAGTRRPARTFGHVPLCPDCGKLSYASRGTARLAARIFHPGKRMIAHKHLGRWHISSETPRDRAWRRPAGTGRTA